MKKVVKLILVVKETDKVYYFGKKKSIKNSFNNTFVCNCK